MISSTMRLKRSRIAYLLKKGKKINNDYLSVKVLPSTASVSHFCVVVSSKVESSSVLRNRIRRQLYEIIRTNIDVLTKPHDIAFICKKKVLELEFSHLQNIIHKIFIAISN